MKIAIAITGASGSLYAKVLLDQLQAMGSELQADLVWSENAHTVWEEELGNQDYKNYPFRVYDKRDFMAPFASGSSSYEALIICPCSMGMVGRIAAGVSTDLISRAADVMLKERRKLICVVRETPYNLIQLRNMTQVAEAGGIICPASPSFYSRPQDFEALAYTVVHRVLQLAGIDRPGFRWQENES